MKSRSEIQQDGDRRLPRPIRGRTPAMLRKVRAHAELLQVHLTPILRRKVAEQRRPQVGLRVGEIHSPSHLEQVAE